MNKRFATFLAASCLLVAFNFAITLWLQKNRPAAKPPQAGQKDAVAKKKGKPQLKKVAPVAERGESEAGGDGAGADDADRKHAEVAKAGGGKNDRAKRKPRPEPPEKLLTLGSADPTQRYRMLVTVTSRGAAVKRIELNSPRFHDIEDRGGYIGHLSPSKPKTSLAAKCARRSRHAGRSGWPAAGQRHHRCRWPGGCRHP